MYRSVILLVGGLVLLSASALPAQDALLAQMYGSGVHAYFSHDYYRAHEYLTSAIEGGTKDPRPHYFRGMVCMRLGRPADARIDFRSGAEKESLDIHKFYDVSKSLERVQGRTRLTLEQYRVKARMAARQRAEKLQKARYDQIRKDEGRLLQLQIGQVPQAPAGLPIEATPEPAEASPFEEDAEGEVDTLPPSEPGVEPAGPPAVEPQMPTEPDPFSNEMPAEPDPFSDEAPAEPVVPPAVGPSPGPGGGGEKSGGLFGALRRSLGKAVGGGAAPPGGAPFGPGPAEPPAEPQAEPPADVLDDDPFSDAPAADEAPSMEPAAEPAGAPATEPADDDPFADPAGPAEPADPASGNENEVDPDDPFAE